MSTHRHFDKICCIALAATLFLTVLFINAGKLGIKTASAAMGYESRLFDTSSVHRIDIIMDDWDSFLEGCTDEEYSPCAVSIDGEAYKNVGIRAKGNTSLTQVSAYGNDRYSFKIEFDCYDSTKSYYGLDKLCLNNIIQDNTYMKDFLSYQLMAEMGVPAPLCSYTNIMVNGETWGLYLAVEGVEESFLRRNYGKDYGNLYKPDSMNMGGGRGNGKDFNMDSWEPSPDGSDTADRPAFPHGEMPSSPPQGSDGTRPGGKDAKGMRMGSDDVLLKYIDDAYDSYKNIFENAKTKISSSDKNRLIASLKKLSAGENLAETVNIDHVIRYFAAHNFVLNFDSYTGSMIHNYYLYETDGKLSMIPWDYNLAFGGFQSSGSAESLINYPIDSPVSGGSIEDRPMLAWIFADGSYTELYHQTLRELVSGYFGTGAFTALMDATKAMISPYVEEDPTKFCTYEEFITGIDTLKEFCLLRAESIQGQLDGAIGATSDTQSQDTLIKAGDITVSDMGSMGNSFGKAKRPTGLKESSQETQAPASQQPTEMEETTKASSMPETAVPNTSFPNGIPGTDGADSSFPNGTTGTDGADPSSQNSTSETDGADGADAPFQDGIPGTDGAGTGFPNRIPGADGADNGFPNRIPGQESASLPSPASLLFLGLSAAALILGLLFALFFRRRKPLAPH